MAAPETSGAGGAGRSASAGAKVLVSYAIRDRFHRKTSTLRVFGNGTARLAVVSFQHRPRGKATLRLKRGELRRLKALVAAAGFQKLMSAYRIRLPEQSIAITVRAHVVELGRSGAGPPPAGLQRVWNALDRIYVRAARKTP